MPARYTIDKERRLVMSVGTGVLTAADMLVHQRQLKKDPDFDPDFSQLSDFTAVTAVDIRGEEVRALAVASIFSPTSRRAMLVATDEQFGLSRMFSALREARGEHGIRVFRDRDEALRWLVAE